MHIESRHKIILIALIACLPLFALIHLYAGQISISFSDIWNSVFQYDESNLSQLIAREVRIPRMLTGLLAGGSLALSGLLMQTLFRNPLAGPYVLGINSGTSLFVALTVMTGIPFFLSDLGLIINALIGAFLFGILILAFAGLIKNQISLLLIGIMLGSFTGAFISILQTLSDANELKVYTLWNLGSLQKVTYEQMPLIILVVFSGLLFSFLLSKPLNLLVLGEKEAVQLGVNVKKVRYAIIGVTAILTGVITAYCGPIAFVGLAVPNIVRILFKTQQHLVLILASFILGSLFLLAVDSIIQVLEAKVLIPINAITSIIGAPIVVFIVFKKLR